MALTGKCLCGAVSYRVETDEAEIGACHCGMCRRWSGGINLAFEGGKDVKIEGEESLTFYSSSDWAERGFCSKCGSSLFYRVVEGPMKGNYVVSAGSLDDWSKAKLASEIYIDAKPRAYGLAGDHPRLTEAEFLASIGMG